MDKDIRRRLGWSQVFERAGDNYSCACLRCGVSRPTLRKWVSRYREQGVEGLASKSRRPHHAASPKISEQAKEWIVELRRRRLGSRRIQSELKRRSITANYRKSFERAGTQISLGARLATQGEEAIRQRDSRRTSAVGHLPDWAKALPIHSG
jgi:transposase